MIALERVTKSFDGTTVLDGVDLAIEAGTVTAIVGPSGAGKSTLLRMFNLLETPDAGRIVIGDANVDATHATTAQQLALRRRTAMVFQQFNLFARRTALENVAEGPQIVRGASREDARAAALAELERVGLADRANHYPAQLSGGQQQRVGIARALAMKPELLLLDEPTSALDPQLVGEVLATIRDIAASGQTMLLVSHEMNFVRRIADRIVLLEGGSIVDDATPEAFFRAAPPSRTHAFLREYHLAQGTTDYQI